MTEPKKQSLGVPSWLPLALHGFFAILTIALFWISPLPPLTDYPNHLARMFIAFNLGEVPGLDEAYRVQWRLAPYLALDALLMLLQQVTDIYTAGKIVCSIAVLGLAVGVLALNRALFGLIRWESLILWPFIFNLAFAFGFMNFLLGMGVALLCVAGWIALQPQPMSRRILWLALFATLNFLCHALSFALFLLIIALYEIIMTLSRWAGWRAALRHGACLCLGISPAILLFVALPDQVDATPPHWGGWRQYQMGLRSPLWFTQHWVEDAMLFLFAGIALIGMFTMPNPYRWLMLGLLAIAFAIPHYVLGVFLVNIRLPILWCLLVAGGLAAPMRPLWRGVFLMMFITFMAASVWRLERLHTQLATCGDYADALRQGLAALPDTLPGKALLSVRDRENAPTRCGYGLHHMNTLAAIERRWFVPEIFTSLPPVSAAPAYAAIDQLAPTTPFGRDIRQKLKDNPASFWQTTKTQYTYMLWIHYGNPIPDMAEHTEVLTEDPNFTLYEVR